MADDQTTGTPGATQDGADAAAAASGTPGASTEGGDAAANADELAKLREIREKYLANLDTVAQAKEDAERWRQEAEQARRASMPPTGYDPAAQRQAQIAQSVLNLRDRDPDAADAMLGIVQMTQEEIQKQRHENAQREARARYDRELAAIPAADQAETERVSRSDNLWPSVAHDRVLAQRFRSTESSLAEQRRKLQEQEDRQKRGVVRTTAEPAAPAYTGNEPTREEYARTLRRAGEGDPAALKQAREWDRREESDGPIKFRSG